MLQVADKAPKANLLNKVGNDYITASPDKKAAEWLEGHIAKSQDKITTVAADLTPALARVLLNRNEDNRKLSEGTYTGYSRDMKNGAWDLNGEPVIISKEGLLNDGQNRCMAAILADVAVPMIFIFGVARKTRGTLNQGKVRSLSDYLEMEGVNYSVVRSTVANLLWQLKNFGALHNGGRAKPTKAELREIIDANLKSVEDCIKFVDSSKMKSALGGTAFLAFILLTLRKTNREGADKFVQSLLDGAIPDLTSPVLYARNRIIAEQGKLRRNLRTELIFKAWNAYRKGETPRAFYLNGGQLPKLVK